MSAADLGGQRGGQLAGDLAHPGVVGGDRQHPAGGGLGGDHPEGLGKGARHDQRLGAGQQLGDLVVLEAADELDRAGRRLSRPRRSPSGGSARKAREDRQRLLLPALQRPSEPGNLAGIVEIAALERRQQPAQALLVLAEAGDLQPRLGVRAPAPAATRRSADRRPWRRSACRRRRPSAGGVGPRGAENGAPCGLARRPPSSAPRQAPRPERLRVDARGARAGSSLSGPGRPGAPPRGTRPCGGSRPGRRRRPPCPRSA